MSCATSEPGENERIARARCSGYKHIEAGLLGLPALNSLQRDSRQQSFVGSNEADPTSGAWQGQ
jgi:hypothetical protein